jgi:hypothetical protein
MVSTACNDTVFESDKGGTDPIATDVAEDSTYEPGVVAGTETGARAVMALSVERPGYAHCRAASCDLNERPAQMLQ